MIVRIYRSIIRVYLRIALVVGESLLQKIGVEQCLFGVKEFIHTPHDVFVDQFMTKLFDNLLDQNGFKTYFRNRRGSGSAGA